MSFPARILLTDGRRVRQCPLGWGNDGSKEERVTVTDARGPRSPAGNGATLGFEQTLWAAADKMRGHMDPSEYKHVVLGLIFLKYISDAFDAHRARLEETPGADPDHPDEYRADNVFWVPPEAGRSSGARP